MSARLAEFSAYYSNRMSYDEVAGLLERVTGQPLLSDQTMQHLVVAKAVEVSQQWQSESQADTAAPLWPEVMPQVDWYDPQSEEVLLLTDAIQVKQQKASRGSGGGHAHSGARDEACAHRCLAGGTADRRLYLSHGGDRCDGPGGGRGDRTCTVAVPAGLCWQV
jgi:hypothetical protein